MIRPLTSILFLFVAASLPQIAFGGLIRITEFMSEGQGDNLSGNGGRRQREFFELTNLGTTSVNVSTWSYNDNNTNDPINWGPTVGSILAGESIILTQMTADDFRSYWNLGASVKVYSFGQLSNLGNGDTINIYNSFTQNSSSLEDTLIYTSDARGSGVSRNRPYDGGTGQYLNNDWVISAVGDDFESHFAPSPTGFPPNFPAPTTGFNQSDYIDLANPGVYVPETNSLILGAFGGLALIAVARRRKAGV